MRLWTIIGVADVAASLRWYQTLLGLPKTAPAHEDFAQIVARDGAILLSLHAWEAHGHPTLSDPSAAKPGNGLILFFRVDDFEPALARARALCGAFEEEAHVNANTGTAEFSLRDPDNYFVSISAAGG